jgi:hypothetical protein
VRLMSGRVRGSKNQGSRVYWTKTLPYPTLELDALRALASYLSCHAVLRTTTVLTRLRSRVGEAFDEAVDSS